MDLSDAVNIARTNQWSVLTTIRGSGRPQLSNVGHLVAPDGLIRISATADRAKYQNVAREPWAALHVTRDDFFAYVVIECDVTTPWRRPRTNDRASASSITHSARSTGRIRPSGITLPG